jgi:hypothetical protein
LEVRDEDPNEVREFFHKALGPSGLEAFMTGAEVLIAEAREKALAQGEQQGALASKASDIIAFLEARGLAVAADQRERITSTADLALLDKWVRRAATIASADELFED